MQTTGEFNVPVRSTEERHDRLATTGDSCTFTLERHLSTAECINNYVHLNRGFNQSWLSVYYKMNIQSVKRKLYDLLEKLRYPDIAQTPFEEFENVILKGSKRIDLLYWLLQEENTGISCDYNKSKDNLNDKLLKNYNEIGLCSDIDVLLGKSHIEKQLQFLSLLTMFIEHVHLPNMETEKTKQILNTSPEDNIESIKNDLTLDLQNISEIKKDNDDNTNTIDSLEYFDADHTQQNFERLCTDIKSSIKEISVNEFDYESTLEKFHTEFKKFTSYVSSDKSLELHSDLCSDIKNLHSSLLIVDKTLKNEDKITSQQIPEISSKTTRPLTTLIKDNIVITEQAINMIKTS